MGKGTRVKIAHLCLFLASLFKFGAKIMLPGIIVDELTLPGWFILDCCLIKHVALNDAKLKGFELRSWSMPDEWGDDMHKATRGKG